MATNSLPQSTLDTFQRISASAVHILARLAARKAVTEELRAQGVRVSLVRPATISAKANEYLANHPELFAVAHERAQRMGMYKPDASASRRSCCRWIKQIAQKPSLKSLGFLYNQRVI